MSSLPDGRSVQVRHVRGVTLPLFAAAVGSAAALLFLVQPLFARLLLPHLGSSPVVWNTALVCYQAGLLAGYAYAHLSASHLRLRWQAVLHLTLLLGAGAAPPPHAAPHARGAVCAAPGGLAGRDAGGIHRRPLRRRRRQQPIATELARRQRPAWLVRSLPAVRREQHRQHRRPAGLSVPGRAGPGAGHPGAAVDVGLRPAGAAQRRLCPGRLAPPRAAPPPVAGGGRGRPLRDLAAAGSLAAPGGPPLGAAGQRDPAHLDGRRRGALAVGAAPGALPPDLRARLRGRSPAAGRLGHRGPAPGDRPSGGGARGTDHPAGCAPDLAAPWGALCAGRAVPRTPRRQPPAPLPADRLLPLDLAGRGARGGLLGAPGPAALRYRLRVPPGAGAGHPGGLPAGWRIAPVVPDGRPFRPGRDQRAGAGRRPAAAAGAPRRRTVLAGAGRHADRQPSGGGAPLRPPGPDLPWLPAPAAALRTGRRGPAPGQRPLLRRSGGGLAGSSAAPSGCTACAR